MDIAEIIRGLRIDAKLSQERLAKKAGTTQAHISKIETGEYNPAWDTVQKILGAIGKELTIRDTVSESIEQRLERIERKLDAIDLKLET